MRKQNAKLLEKEVQEKAEYDAAEKAARVKEKHDADEKATREKGVA